MNKSTKCLAALVIGLSVSGCSPAYQRNPWIFSKKETKKLYKEYHDEAINSAKENKEQDMMMYETVSYMLGKKLGMSKKELDKETDEVYAAFNQ